MRPATAFGPTATPWPASPSGPLGELRGRFGRGRTLRLPTWRPRLPGFRGNELEPGEQVLATLVLQVKGAVTRAACVGGFGGAALCVVASTADDAAAHAEEARHDVDGLAGRLPMKPLVLVLTDRERVLVHSFALMSLDLTFETEYRASEIASIEPGWGFFARHARVRFVDGSELPFDLPRGHDYEPFCRRYPMP